MRTLVHSDASRLLNLYAGDDLDPDAYFIWLERRQRSVMRRPSETAVELWGRVLLEVDAMWRTLDRMATDPGAVAQVFAGDPPTDQDVRAMEINLLARLLWREANSRGRGSGASRVEAAKALAELLDRFPGADWSENIRGRLHVRHRLTC